jgi:hypothetical protein
LSSYIWIECTLNSMTHLMLATLKSVWSRV